MATPPILAGGATGGGEPSTGVSVVAWLVVLFLVAPSIVVIPISFGSKDVLVFPPEEYSFYLYRQFFLTSDWVSTSIMSAKIAVIATALALVFGSLGAYGLVRFRFVGRRLVTMLLLSPMFVPQIVVAVAFYIYFASLGLQGSQIALVLAHTAFVLPYVVIVIMASLANIDPQLEMAASTMGAGRLYIFRRVTLPLIAPAVISAGLFSFLLSFDELVIGLFLTNFETKTLPVKMWESIIYEVSPVLAAVSTLLTIVAFGLSVFVLAGQRKPRDS